jgi:hypothetical protein
MMFDQDVAGHLAIPLRRGEVALLARSQRNTLCIAVRRTKKQRASRGLPAELKGSAVENKSLHDLASPIVCTTNWAERLEAATCYRRERYEL